MRGNVFCEKSIQVPSAEITSSLKSRIIVAEDVNITSTLLGEEATISKLVAGVASFSGDVKAKNVIAGAVHVENLTSDQLVSKGPISIEDGDLSVCRGALKALNVEIDGNVTTDSLYSRNIVSMNIKAQNSLNASQIIGRNGQFEDARINTLTLNGNLTVSNGAVIAEITRTQSLFAKRADFKEGVTAISFIGKRIYSEDISASGYITAQDVIVKGDVTVNNNADFKKAISVDKLTAKDVQIENSLQASTATFGGLMKAGGVEVRKISIHGDLYLNGEDIAKKLNDLVARVKSLEAMLV